MAHAQYQESKAYETKDKKLQKEKYDLCEHLEQFGLRKILDMEKFRRYSNKLKQAQEYSAGGIPEQRQGRKSNPLGRL